MNRLKLHLRKLGAIAILSVLLIPFQNCSKISFKELSSTGEDITSLPEDIEPDLPFEPVEEPPPVVEEPPPVVVEPPPVVVEPPPVVVEPPPVVVVEPPPPPPPQYKMQFSEKSEGYACSPLGSVSVPNDKSGLKTELRYLTSPATLEDAIKVHIRATSYFDESQASLFTKVPETLYLSDVNVPARAFESGFATTDSSVIKDTAGAALIEYFGLKMDTLLKLGPNDPEGYYELATVSDDGTVVQIKENDQWVTIIDNDGNHAPKMGCMSGRIHMTRTTRLPVRIFYNQGPRWIISNVLMWNYRGTSSSTVGAGLPSDTQIKVHCGVESHNMFWNATTSAPQTYINDLVAAQWKTVSTLNFQLPDNEVNPCFFSKYDLNPVLASVGTTKVATLTLSEPAAITVNVYKMAADGTKTFVRTMNLSSSSTHALALDSLSISSVYHLEVFMTIAHKQIKVLKEYAVSFQQVQ